MVHWQGRDSSNGPTIPTCCLPATMSSTSTEQSWRVAGMGLGKGWGGGGNHSWLGEEKR